MGKRIRIVSTKEVVQPAESTNQGENISSEASDPSPDKSLLQGSKKRARGPTKKKEIWNLASDEQILVTFNELCQPIGDEGNELTNFLGTLVRMPQHIGINYPEWRKVPKEKKEDLWSIIKEKFSFESDQSEDRIKGWIMMDMSSKWKSWKYELKKSSYDPSKTIDEIVESQTDDRVEASKFRKLVASWFTEKKTDEKEQGCKSVTRRNADIKARSTDKETTNSSNWENDDMSKVKGPERRGAFRCTGKFLFRKNKTLHDPQVPLLKAQVKFLRQGFMMFDAAVQEQVPNLNMSSFMNYMNMESKSKKRLKILKKRIKITLAKRHIVVMCLDYYLLPFNFEEASYKEHNTNAWKGALMTTLRSYKTLYIMWSQESFNNGSTYRGPRKTGEGTEARHDHWNRLTGTNESGSASGSASSPLVCSF
ncbi:hypothetical protein CTI12_AA337240 [Artemisia annua]|uniref:Uncharacterized protein n=1 Tax=Artemisia annua TaxID=35608 RepID=A0A2U1MWA3_ARTAN|nr:hypothetical protein CTI12_AA337240 [Artemisia annua]